MHSTRGDVHPSKALVKVGEFNATLAAQDHTSKWYHEIFHIKAVAQSWTRSKPAIFRLSTSSFHSRRSSFNPELLLDQGARSTPLLAKSLSAKFHPHRWSSFGYAPCFTPKSRTLLLVWHPASPESDNPRPGEQSGSTSSSMTWDATTHAIPPLDVSVVKPAIIWHKAHNIC